MSERVLVTGGDGFLGTHIVRELLGRGHTVRVMSEPGREAPGLTGMAVERVEGDLRQARAVVEAVQGCAHVVHAAASTAIWPSKSELLRQINVDGTRNVVSACLSEGVERLVHVGSANSFGFGSKDSPGDETRPYGGGVYGLGYMDTKREAMDLVLAAVRDQGLDAVVVAPTFMLGPGDFGPGSGQMLLSVAAGEVPGITRGGRCYVHVRDVAMATVNALTMGRKGECYIAGHENLSYGEAFGLMARVTGAKPPRLQFPGVAVLAVGALGSLQGKLLGRAPKVSMPMARISTDEHYYSSAKAVHELEMPQTPVETAVREAWAWFREHAYDQRSKS